MGTQSSAFWPGEREARCKDDQPSLRAQIVHARHPGEGPLVLHRGEPTFKEVGPEREEEASLGEVVRRDDRATKGNPGGLPQRSLREGLVLDAAAAHRREEIVHEVGHGGIETPCQEKVSRTVLEALHQRRLRLVPPDGPESSAFPNHVARSGGPDCRGPARRRTPGNKGRPGRWGGQGCPPPSPLDPPWCAPRFRTRRDTPHRPTYTRWRLQG